jgi:hypothetical protein
MTKQKLTFKVEKGLEKIAGIYAAADKDAGAAQAYFDNPAALMEALQVAPHREIRLSPGYKRLADALCSFDFDSYQAELADGPKGECGLSLPILDNMWKKVSGVDCAIHIDRELIAGPIVAVAVSMITVAVAFVNLSGRNEDEVGDKTPVAPAVRRPRVPGGPKFSATKEELQHLAQHAQIVADHIWLS